MNNRLCEMFGIEFPIFAFTHCRDVAAAVSKAGGLGVLGAITFTPEQLEIELNWLDEHVGGKPYGVDVVMPVKSVDREAGLTDPATLAQELDKLIDPERKAFVEELCAKYDLPPLPKDADRPEGPIGEGILGWTEATGAPLVDIALGHDIALLASALGPPPMDVIDQAHSQGVKVAALVGSAHQGVRQVQNGADIIIASGYEAGGHTGELTSMILVPEVVEAVAPVPVLAAGGIGSGKQMAAAIALGADGVWTGSIWLTTQESDVPPLMMEKLLGATSKDTVRSRALTGKPARLLKTGWTDAWESPDTPEPLPMPLQFMLAMEAMARANHYQNREMMGMPVGQIVGHMNKVRPVKDVIFEMVEEFVEATERVESFLAPEKV